MEGTAAQDYEGIIVQDHEATFYKYGTDHQECLAHVLRGLKDSILNEPDRTWCHSSNYLEPFSSVYLDVLSGSDSVLVRLNGGYSA